MLPVVGIAVLSLAVYGFSAQPSGLGRDSGAPYRAGRTASGGKGPRRRHGGFHVSVGEGSGSARGRATDVGAGQVAVVDMCNLPVGSAPSSRCALPPVVRRQSSTAHRHTTGY